MSGSSGSLLYRTTPFYFGGPGNPYNAFRTTDSDLTPGAVSGSAMDGDQPGCFVFASLRSKYSRYVPRFRPLQWGNTPVRNGSRTALTIHAIACFFSVPADLSLSPQQTCVNSLVNDPAKMGCETGGTACLCSKPDFQFGIHDCAVQACTPDEVATVTDFATALCAGMDLANPLEHGGE